MALTIGANTRYATYKSGTNTTKLIFEYKVATGDTDTDGIAFPSSNVVQLNGGTMKDAPGNNANLVGVDLYETGARSSHKVDSSSAIGPTISSVAFTSTATNSTYKKDEKIQATVTFGSSVTVDTTGGTPKLTLKIGSSNKDASYKSGSPGTALVFEYTVASGDEDTNGIEIEANKLSLNSGTIVDTTDSTINAILTHTAVTASTSHKVDAVAPTVATTNGVAITSTAKTYKIGDKIQVTVTFNESVTVTGTPQVALTIGSASKQASYTTTGSTTTKLVFEYTVVIGDEDTDGISIAANKLTLNSGTIKDAVGNAATLTHAALATQSSHKVAANVPNVTDIDIGSSASNSTYSIGTTLQVWATFNKNVTVTGTPQLTLTIGSASKDASYVRTLNNVTLVFEYTIAEGDEDTDGISVAANSLKLNSGTITDATNVSKNALLTHDALATQSDHKVDGVKPTINGFSMHSTPAKGTTYKAGEDIEVKVTFTKNMRTYTTGGTPQLTLKIGTADKIAPYSGGFGTPNVRFKYRVAAGMWIRMGFLLTQTALNSTAALSKAGQATMPR